LVYPTRVNVFPEGAFFKGLFANVVTSEQLVRENQLNVRSKSGSQDFQLSYGSARLECRAETDYAAEIVSVTAGGS
jgi:hypothetical protein